MSVAGVICECNPFHGGHEYLFRRAKEKNGALIAVMSTEFCQRGDAAVFDPFLRAEVLLERGADLVVSLPFPYSSASADYFAAAGVDLLSRLGADELWFGSESGDPEFLSRAAECTGSAEFEARFRAKLTGAAGTAEAYFDTLSELTGDARKPRPNDALAIAYLRAIRRTGGSLCPVAVRRVGSAFDDPTVGEGYPSAGAIRRLLDDGKTDEALALMPSGDILRAAIKRGEAPAALWRAERFFLGALRLLPENATARIAELSGGLGERLCEAARTSETLAGLFSACATARYPDARIRRGMIYALTGVERSDLCAPPAYVRLLGANARGRELLSDIRREEKIAVVTKHRDLPDTPEAARQAELEHRAHEIYTLCKPVPSPSDGEWKQTPRML